MKFKNCIILLILIVSNLTLSLDLNAQFISKYQIAFGFITTQILGNNPATMPIVSSSDVADAVTGGSFPMSQPGLEFRMTFPIDEDNNLRVPFSIDYTFFGGKERLNYNRNIVDYFSHTLNVFGINTGIQYVFLEIPFARAKVYTGIDARITSIHNIGVEWYRDYLNPVFSDEIYNYNTKPNTWRLGGAINLGAEGRLINKWYINFGGSLMINNLIGRDNSRGELFTPITMFETGESLVYSFQFHLLIQYKL
jgi:hypothetical protein